MFGQSSMQKRNCISPARLSENNLQWKKASKNLQNFIQSQHFTLVKAMQSSRETRTDSVKKEKINLMRSMENVQYTNKQIQRNPPKLSSRSKEANKNLLLNQRSLRSPKKILASSRKQILPCSDKINKQIGIQTCQEQIPVKRRDLTEQNRCLKELIQILQNQILSYGKTISENQNKIYKLNSEIEKLKDKYNNETHKVSEGKQKLQKQIQLNKCMEYIIAELNQKVSTLLNKNTQLQQTIEQYKVKEERNLTQTFSESQSQLSMNSQIQKKCQYQEIFKNTDSIIEVLESNILIDNKQNWSFSALDMDMSRFSKTPNKIHEVSSYEDNERRPSSTGQFSPDKQIDEIILKHKMEINKLKEKVKYYEIENQMLRRKKDLSEKNTFEIQQLKFRIQKLSEQNKLIKLMQQGKKKKVQSKDEQKTQKNANRIDLSPYKQTNNVKNSKEKQQDSSLLESKAKQNQLLKPDPNNNQQPALSEQKISPKRKSPLQRKFVRRQSRTLKSQQSFDEDSQISLQFSPERI